MGHNASMRLHWVGRGEGMTRSTGVSVSYPPKEAVYCHACNRDCQLLPLETVRTCPCTACSFCLSCRTAPRDHDCNGALQLATAVVQKLTQSATWPFVSIVAPDGTTSLPVTISSAFGWAHILRSTISCSLTERESNFLIANLALVTRLVGERVTAMERCTLCERTR